MGAEDFLAQIDGQAVKYAGEIMDSVHAAWAAAEFGPLPKRFPMTERNLKLAVRGAFMAGAACALDAAPQQSPQPDTEKLRLQLVLLGALKAIREECHNGGYPNEIVATRMIERIDEMAAEAVALAETPSPEPAKDMENEG